jgi:hypothetical protein
MLATVLRIPIRLCVQLLGHIITSGCELGNPREISEDYARNLGPSAPVQDGYRPSSGEPDLRT